MEALGIVARENELDRAEKPLVKFGLLVGQALADAITDADAAVFQFQHAHGDAVDVKHDVRPPLMVAEKGDFLDNGEVIFLGNLPIDEMDGLRDPARFGLDRHTIAKKAIDRLVVIVEAPVAVVRLTVKNMKGPADLGGRVAILGQVGFEQVFFDIAVVFPFSPIAQGAIAKLVTEQRDDAVLCDPFRLVDGTHVVSLLPQEISNGGAPMTRGVINPLVAAKTRSPLRSWFTLRPPNGRPCGNPRVSNGLPSVT